MSLFDVIKYPISVPPEPGQLEALPPSLFRHWIDNHTTDWHSVDEDGRYSPLNVGRWMRSAYSSNGRLSYFHNEINRDLENLKIVIRDWNTEQ